MLPNLTPAVARALEAARDRARQAGQSHTQPMHLLLGMLEEEEGRAAALLAGAGLQTHAARQALASRPAENPPASDAPISLHPRVEEMLEQARLLAGEFSGERTVASEHILLTLLRQDIPLRRQLETQGLDFARLETVLLAAAGPPLELDEPLRLVDTTEKIDTARMLDANGNRAREALRVVEDYCRFALDDAFLSRELKQLRHDLAAALGRVSGKLGLEARETARDVGTALRTEQEGQRLSPLEVARVNCKRLQEALRSLEEFGKLLSPDLGAALEQLRYRGYTLERAVVLGASARQRLQDAQLYILLTGSQCLAALDWTIQEAAAGGAQVFQLREKRLDDRRLLERARQVRRWTRQAKVLFIVNDRPDIARLAEADGVHVGQDELPVKEVRRIVGPDALIGVSTHNIEQVRQAVLDGASYIGVGPTFPSGTKEFAELAGLDFVRQAAGETSLPAFAIGGVTPATIGAAAAAGARRVAVSQAVCRADDPRAIAALLRQALPPR